MSKCSNCEHLIWVSSGYGDAEPECWLTVVEGKECPYADCEPPNRDEE